MRRHLVSVAILIAAVLLLLPAAAFGDNVQNDVVADDGDKIVAVTVGQSAVVSYRIHATNNDGQNGCNAEYGSGATVTPAALTGVAITPASRTFTTCDTWQTFTFTPSVPGSWDVTVAAAGGSGGYNVNPGKLTLVARAAVTSSTSNSVPALTLPADMTVEGDTTGGANVTFTVSGADREDGALTPVCDVASGAFFALGGPHTVTCAVTDSGGLQDSGSFTVTVVDTIAPVLAGMPGDRAASAGGAGGAVVTWTAPTATDTVDAAAVTSCAPASGSLFTLGSTTVSCAASDASGNTSAAQTFTVRVTYSWSDFLQPVNTDGSSTFKVGSTIPVKFALTGASAAATDAVARIHVARVSNGVMGTEAEASSSTPASSGNLFRYADGQYIYNHGTKGLEAGTYRIRVDLGDGVTTRTVLVSLRK